MRETQFPVKRLSTTNKPVIVRNLQNNYGYSSGIAWDPDGWRSEADTVYHIEVTDVPDPLSYDVHMVDCRNYP